MVFGNSMDRVNHLFEILSNYSSPSLNIEATGKGSVMVSVCKCLWFLEKIKASQLFFSEQFTLSELSIL